MGGSASVPKDQYKAPQPDPEAIAAANARRIAWAMPSWCIDSFVVKNETIELANSSWKYCMSGESPPFHAAKAKESSLTPLVFFYNQFYYFLFELLPDAKQMFTKGMKAQGRMLANVIKYIITNLRESDEGVLKESLEHLARVHNARGITADQYSVMGMCLVHTVRICTGGNYWTNKHKDAWVHIYSKMMSIIIPVVIAGDVEEGVNGSNTSDYYKTQNLNQEADAASVTRAASSSSLLQKNKAAEGGNCPAIPKTGGGMPHGACPALAGSPSPADEELSNTMQEHFKDNANKHVQQLAIEAAQARSAEKYKTLARIVEVAQKVENYLRETGSKDAQGVSLPIGSISGANLLSLLTRHHWVENAAGAEAAAQHFILMGIMTPSDGIEKFQGDQDSIYSFASALHVNGIGSSKTSDSKSGSTSGSDSDGTTSFKPKTFLSEGRLVIEGNVSKALQDVNPSPTSQLSKVDE